MIGVHRLIAAGPNVLAGRDGGPGGPRFSLRTPCELPLALRGRVIHNLAGATSTRVDPAASEILRADAHQGSGHAGSGLRAWSRRGGHFAGLSRWWISPDDWRPAVAGAIWGPASPWNVNETHAAIRRAGRAIDGAALTRPRAPALHPPHPRLSAPLSYRSATLMMPRRMAYLRSSTRSWKPSFSMTVAR